MAKRARRKAKGFFPPDDQSAIAKWDRAMAMLCDAPTFLEVERTLDADREAGQVLVQCATHAQPRKDGNG